MFILSSSNSKLKKQKENMYERSISCSHEVRGLFLLSSLLFQSHCEVVVFFVCRFCCSRCCLPLHLNLLEIFTSKTKFCNTHVGRSLYFFMTCMLVIVWVSFKLFLCKFIYKSIFWGTIKSEKAEEAKAHQPTLTTF